MSNANEPTTTRDEQVAPGVRLVTVAAGGQHAESNALQEDQPSPEGIATEVEKTPTFIRSLPVPFYSERFIYMEENPPTTEGGLPSQLVVGPFADQQAASDFQRKRMAHIPWTSGIKFILCRLIDPAALPPEFLAPYTGPGFACGPR